jgi:hypothetical protein
MLFFRLRQYSPGSDPQVGHFGQFFDTLKIFSSMLMRERVISGSMSKVI